MTACCCCKSPPKEDDADKKEDAHKTGMTALVITEILRWIAIVVPLYLSIWQYTEHRGFTVFVAGVDEQAQFWCIVTASIVAATLFVFLPLKLLALQYRRTHHVRHHRWRPSIVVYVMICALPSFLLVFVAVKYPLEEEKTVLTTPNPDTCSEADTLPPEAAVVLQVVVLCLTITEWMSKQREEVMTYDLVSAMAVDFFFAYDGIDFIMMMAYEPEVFNSDWVYVCFVFAWVAMFRYVPMEPVSLEEKGAPRGATVFIIVTLVLSDIPFLIIRLYIFFQFGYLAYDFINPVKNAGMIIFGMIQLAIIYYNKNVKKTEKERFADNRISKYPGLWRNSPDENRVTPIGDADTKDAADAADAAGHDVSSVYNVGSGSTAILHAVDASAEQGSKRWSTRNSCP